MPTLNFLIAVIIGFIIGFLTQLIMEVLYFRSWRRQVRDARIAQLEADLATSQDQLNQALLDLETRDARIIDLDRRLARGQARLNALQHDAAMQRQRAMAAAETADAHLADDLEDHAASSTAKLSPVAANPDPAQASSALAEADDSDTEALLAEGVDVATAGAGVEDALRPESGQE